jgi:predicted urease superfamily metal-dependent hydrolase
VTASSYELRYNKPDIIIRQARARTQAGLLRVIVILGSHPSTFGSLGHFGKFAMQTATRGIEIREKKFHARESKGIRILHANPPGGRERGPP